MLRRYNMAKALLAGLAVGAGLAGSVLLVSASAYAQLTAEPASLSVSLPQYGTVTETLTLTNTGSATLAFCLSFERPLQPATDGPPGTLRLSPDALGSRGGTEACGPYGEAFARLDQTDLPGPAGWSPYGMASTPDGRLFTADEGQNRRTHELTPGLGLVRSFEHPRVAELTSFAFTNGVAYREDTGTLWWLNEESSAFTVARALLLEGDLDGVATGRRVELPVADSAPPPAETGFPTGLAYDAASARFYFLDFANDDLWAVDTLGNVIDGYPIDPVFPYDQLGFGLDAHRGIDATASSDGGVWLEVGTALPGQTRVTRVVALNTDGSWDGVETPVLAFPGGEVMSGEPLRSRSDPNGAMYYPAQGFGVEAVFAVRPHPLPPSWLVVGEQEEGEPSEAWDGTLGPGESRAVALTFRAGARAVGDYAAVLQAFEAASGAAVEVPLALTVTMGTAQEEGPAEPDAPLAVSVYPNPFAQSATVALTLGDETRVRVAVYDVLGREVTVLADGALAAGRHDFRLDGRGLPAGVYLVRGEGGGHSAGARITLVR